MFKPILDNRSPKMCSYPLASVLRCDIDILHVDSEAIPSEGEVEENIAHYFAAAFSHQAMEYRVLPKSISFQYINSQLRSLWHPFIVCKFLYQASDICTVSNSCWSNIHIFW